MATKQSKAKVNKEAKPKRSNSLKGKPRVMTPAVLENPGGRPSVFDVAAPKIITAIRGGNTYKCASAGARITYNTFNEWIKQGLSDKEAGLDTQFSKFYEDVKQAESDMAQECVQAWKNFIPMNWQAARDFLGRRHGDEWGAKDQVDITSQGQKIEGQPVFLPMKKQDEQET